MTDLVGKRLGEFEVVRELGRGGMGVVFEAVQTSLNRRVALKVLGSGLGLTAKAVSRFRREAEAAAKLHHTNIVPVYATGEEGGFHFYAMELIEGPSLDRVIADLRQARSDTRPTKSLAPELAATGPYVEASAPTGSAVSSGLSSGAGYFDTVAGLIADVAEALHHAHQNGVIHRDIKPGNLLLGADGRLSVNDFGLARALEEPGMTTTGEFVGTPAYMAPEQIAGGRIPVDHRCDIYSLGATLYELLTLAPPFLAERRDQLLAMVVQKEPPAPRRVNPKVPRDLETICLKCLEKDPDRRYRSAQELADDLRRFVNRFAIEAKRAGPLTRARKWVKRNPALAGAGVTVLLALGVAAGSAWQARESAARHEEERQRLEAEARKRADEAQREMQRAAIERAMEEALNGRRTEALRHIVRAEELEAAPDELALARGVVELYQANSKAAAVHFESAHRRNPSVATTALLARCYLDMYDWRYESLLNQLVAAKPRTFEDFLFRGDVLCAWGDLGGLDDLRRAVELQPNSALAALALAEGEYLKALDSDSVHYAQVAVQRADDVRKRLPECERARVAMLLARTVLWDRLKDGGGDGALLDDVGRDLDSLVKALRFSGGVQVIHACAHYYERRNRFVEATQYLGERWKRGKESDALAGPLYACSLVQAGDLPEALKVADEIRDSPYEFARWWGAEPYARAEGNPADREAFARVRKGVGDDSNRAYLLAFTALVLNKRTESQELFKIAGASPSAKVFRGGWSVTHANYGAGVKGIDLLKEAGPSRLNRAEAHLLLGLHALLDDNRPEAKRQFDECVKTRVFFYAEPRLAAVFLERMKKDTNWPRGLNPAKDP